MTIAELTTFLGWSTAFNIALLFLYVMIILCCRNNIQKLHSKIFGVTVEKLPKIYMEFLGRYKILIIFFNLVPYLVLRSMM